MTDPRNPKAGQTRVVGRAHAPRAFVAAAAIAALLIALARASGPAWQAASQEASPADLRSLLSTADDIFHEMSQITGLPAKAPLKKRIVSRPEMKRYLTEDVEQEYTPREIHQQEATLQAFGLVSSEFDLKKFFITFYTEQAAGVYDPRQKTMLIADWVPPAMQKMVLSHELTHALQDQSFDLWAFQHAVKEDDDATGARQAVVEGYATAAMLQEMIKPASLGNLPGLAPLLNSMIEKPMAEFPAYSSAPFFFRYSALFPYSEGIAFMQVGLAQGGWKRLNRLFDQPPSTTKQIFEPDLYFGSLGLTVQGGAPGTEITSSVPSATSGATKTSASGPAATPVKISLPHAPPLDQAPGLSLLVDNTLGQLGYYCLLGQFVSEDEARKLAPSWLADRYLIYENASTHSLSLVARSRWSSSETALAFSRDYRTILEKKFPEFAPDARSTPDSFIGHAASGLVVFLRQGDVCRWAEGVPAAQTDAVLGWLRALK